MYLHKTKNGHYTPPCCYFSGELEVVECLPQTFSCDFWDDTTKYNYCLICGKTNLNDSVRKRLIYINWSLIIDFDEETQNDGLYKSYGKRN